MHIPDGFMNGMTALGAGAVAASSVGVSLKRAGKKLADRQVPLAGLTAAFIFVLQMLNFPVAAGTSGHLLGGALAAILLGPSIGLVALSVVVIMQALLFADGGVSALGLNVLNMAVLTVLSGWILFRSLMTILPKRGISVVVASAIAAWASVVVSSMGFVVEYALGGVGGVPTATVFGAMTGVHSLIGIGEGLITAGIVASVMGVRPDLVFGAQSAGVEQVGSLKMNRPATVGLIVIGLAVAVALAAVVAPSADPDGLERVAIDQGFAEEATDSATADSPLADYEVDGVSSEFSSTALAAVIGLLATLAISGMVFSFLRRRRPAPSS